MIFDNSVPGLPETAAKENLTPLEYMRKYGVFKVSDKAYSRASREAADAARRTSSSTACRARVQHAVAAARVLLTDDG